MNSRERFLNAFTDRLPDRPPVWIMRQAGRYLPEYRALKEKSDFLTMVKTPELAAEVTLQPLQRYPQLDAAIIFSDILIVPEALGIPYSFRDKGGIEMSQTIGNKASVDQLEVGAIQERTAYLCDAIRLVKKSIGNGRAMLGFGGSPWTLATYMIEGGSSKDYSKSRAMFHHDNDTFECLMEKLSLALVELFKSQIEAGVDAIQIFDSWAAAAPEGKYWECSLKWMSRIISEISSSVPVILFAKGMGSEWPQLIQSGARALAADHSIELAEWRARLPREMTVQGNLDPLWMTRPPEEAVKAAKQLLQSMAPFQRYIFNLGHGITPDAHPETLGAVLRCIEDISKSD